MKKYKNEIKNCAHEAAAAIQKKWLVGENRSTFCEDGLIYASEGEIANVLYPFFKKILDIYDK